MSSLSTSLKNSYQRYLQPYEEWVKSAKPGVQQQIEAEYGGPITPSPATSPLKRTPMDRPANSPLSSMGPDSPAIRASSALAASVVGTPDKSDTEMADATPVKAGTPVAAGNFTAVNSGGFTPVNSGPATFTPVNSINCSKREVESGLTPTSRRNEKNENGTSSSKRSTPEAKGSPASLLKRQHGQEAGVDNDESGKEANGKTDESESGERRSKRLKKGWFFPLFGA